MLVTGAALGFVVAAGFHASLNKDADQMDLLYRADLVRRHRLTDLSLFTEARYTRHPAMADLHSAFQDHPMALEHFPSGSFISPPALLKRNHATKP